MLRPPAASSGSYFSIVFAVVFAISALALGPCAKAQTTPPLSTIPSEVDNGINTRQPTPQAFPAAGASSSSNDEDAAAENELLALANKSRELAGAPLLRMDETLRAAALAHGRLMVASAELSHQFPGELALLARIANVGEVKLDRAGENVAYSNCASGVHDALMRSAPHRENLLDHGFDLAGIAAIWSKGRLYVVQDFGHEVPSYSAEQSRKLISRAIAATRQQAELPELSQLTPPHLDQAACSLASENRPNARLLATAYDNRRIIAYTRNNLEKLPDSALRLLRDPSLRQFAVGSCYARNAAYPTGMYWVAILLY